MRLLVSAVFAFVCLTSLSCSHKPESVRVLDRFETNFNAGMLKDMEAYIHVVSPEQSVVGQKDLVRFLHSYQKTFDGEIQLRRIPSSDNSGTNELVRKFQVFRKGIEISEFALSAKSLGGGRWVILADNPFCIAVDWL